MYYVCARLAVKQRSAGLERRGGLGVEGKKRRQSKRRNAVSGLEIKDCGFGK